MGFLYFIASLSSPPPFSNRTRDAVPVRWCVLRVQPVLQCGLRAFVLRRLRVAVLLLVRVRPGVLRQLLPELLRLGLPWLRPRLLLLGSTACGTAPRSNAG